MYTMEEDYESEELLSGAETSDEEARPKYPRKARLYARNIVDGDVSQQYTLLWDYSAELRRVDLGNTCKIQLERVSPDTPSYRLGGNQGKPPLLSKVRGNQSLTRMISNLNYNNLQAKGKAKQTCGNQQSQGTLRVTRSAQKSQQSGDTIARTSRTNTNKGKKKSLPLSPVIPKFARRMFVGQLVSKLTQVWQHHIDIVKATTSEQAAALAAEDAADPVPTSAGEIQEPTIPANQAQSPTIPVDQDQGQEPNDNVRDGIGSKESGESSQTKGGRKG
ncbi:hypothetical protein SESBI_08654 [Sesbania bispinosa]|nr:hypothetical protein SESBI_08654 [Sesbania bispinosa]